MRMNIKKILLILIILIFVGITVKVSIKDPTHKNEANLYESMNLFTSILYEVKQSYYKDISFTTLISYAIEGMLEKLDPYSSYLKKDDFETLNNYTNGEFYGIGIQFFKNKNNMIEVLHVVDNSPAKKAGIKSGDIIISINNNPVIYLGINEVLKRLQEKSSNIKIKLSHKNNHLYYATLNKVKIKLTPISSKIYKNTLYIKIPSFNKNTSKELRKVINKNINLIKAVILDLRNNGGGLFNQAIQTADLFLDNKLIAKLENSNTHHEEIFMAKNGDILKGLPLVVLIDETSASSSEILAGSLQENNRAIIVGTKSFGKGVVQDIISLGNGDYIKITTSEYVLPSDKKVNNQGIIPDIIIFKNGVICERCNEEQLDKLKEQETELILNNKDTKDYQLNKALEILRSEITYIK